MPLSRYLPYIVAHTCACRRPAFACEASASGDCLVVISLFLSLPLLFSPFLLQTTFSFFLLPSASSPSPPSPFLPITLTSRYYLPTDSSSCLITRIRLTFAAQEQSPAAGNRRDIAVAICGNSPARRSDELNDPQRNSSRWPKFASRLLPLAA